MRKRVLGIALVLLVLAGWWILRSISQAIEVPRSAKILEVNGENSAAAFRPPAGKLYSLLLATPSGREKLGQVAGKVRLVGPDGVLTERRFGPEDLVPANWLDRERRASVIIGRANDWNIDSIMTEHPTIRVELLLDVAPDFQLELWASWLSSGSIDRDVATVREKTSGR